MDNLALYNRLRPVPEEAKKSITAGRLKGMTDINPVWRIKALTEAFGPCGVGWWYTVDRKEIVRDETTKQGAAFVDITLHYIDPESGCESHGIPGTGGASFVANEKNGPYMSDECYKMALTDALSVSAKALGLAADVYFARGCAETKYTDKTPENNASAQNFQHVENLPIAECAQCHKALYKHEEGRSKNGKIYCLACLKAGVK